MAEAYLEKIRQLPRDIKVYASFGHGSDLCDERGQPIIHQVPNGCLYITNEECGLMGYADTIRENAFHSIDPSIKAKLKYPYLFLRELNPILNPTTAENIRRRQGFERTYENVIKIHFPGENYVCSQLYPLAYWYETQSVGFSTSGLISKDKAERVPLASYPGGTVSTYFSNFHTLLDINKEEIVSYFQASVHPTPEQVRDVLDNFTLDGRRYFDTGSYHPRTRQEGGNICHEIEKKIEEKLGWYKDISDKDGPEAFMTNTYMMEKFPGIHYNLVCRSMDRACSPVRRRAESINENRPRRGYLDTPAVSRAIIDHILADPTLDAAIRRVIEAKR